MADDNKHIAKAWQEYLTHVIPRHASPVQINESRKAFYCGAIAMMDISLTMSEGPDCTDEDEDKMQAMFEELAEFKREVTTPDPVIQVDISKDYKRISLINAQQIVGDMLNRKDITDMEQHALLKVHSTLQLLLDGKPGTPRGAH